MSQVFWKMIHFSLVQGGLFAGAVFTLAWLIALRYSFWSLVDAVWALGLGALCAIYFAFSQQRSAELFAYLGLIVFWSLRLGLHLTVRLKAHFPQEDRRYQTLRSLWKDSPLLSSFLFFQFQGLSQVILAIPFALASCSGEVSRSALFWFFASVSLVGWMGETVADLQLRKFIQDPLNSGKVCDHGLWKYSRHPNYFFEWIIWCGFGGMGFAFSAEWVAFLSPVIMLLLLLFVTGVPPAEASSLRSKGRLYESYQSRTSVFVPWFPKTQPPKEAK